MSFFVLPLTPAALKAPPDKLADPQAREYLVSFRDQLESYLNDLAHAVLVDHETQRERWLSCFMDTLGAGAVFYFLGTAAAAFIFPRAAITRRLTVQANVGAGATLTVSCYNGAEAAGNRALEVVSGVGVGRTALETKTPTNAGMEIFRPGDGVNAGDKCFIKVASAGGTVTEISVELGAELL